MRETYHHELDQLVDGLVKMTELVENTMSRATNALLHVDLSLADQVIADDEAVIQLHRELDDQAIEMLARQQPVATDLRTIVSSLRITEDLKRMSRLARHVAEVAKARHPRCAVPADLRAMVTEMGQVAVRITDRTAKAIALRDPRALDDLELDDNEMDRLQLALYERLSDNGWPHGTEVGMDMALVGRYYERYADHAVSVARRVAFVAGRHAFDRT
ncbi:MAG TPA: phosphate signaling complex protein PhoU [Pseudonocardiaceae bacterium]